MHHMSWGFSWQFCYFGLPSEQDASLPACFLLPTVYCQQSSCDESCWVQRQMTTSVIHTFLMMKKKSSNCPMKLSLNFLLPFSYPGHTRFITILASRMTLWKKTYALLLGYQTIETTVPKTEIRGWRNDSVVKSFAAILRSFFPYRERLGPGTCTLEAAVASAATRPHVQRRQAASRARFPDCEPSRYSRQSIVLRFSRGWTPCCQQTWPVAEEWPPLLTLCSRLESTAPLWKVAAQPLLSMS